MAVAALVCVILTTEVPDRETIGDMRGEAEKIFPISKYHDRIGNGLRLCVMVRRTPIN